MTHTRIAAKSWYLRPVARCCKGARFGRVAPALKEG
jgi:hypothetical protein